MVTHAGTCHAGNQVFNQSDSQAIILSAVPITAYLFALESLGYLSDSRMVLLSQNFFFHSQNVSKKKRKELQQEKRECELLFFFVNRIRAKVLFEETRTDSSRYFWIFPIILLCFSVLHMNGTNRYHLSV